MPLLSGPELDNYIQTEMNPFVVKDGKAVDIKPASERFSISSNNANHPPWEEQAKGIALAHADKDHPTVGGLALSYNSSRKGGSVNAPENIIRGARQSYESLLDWVDAYNLRGMALFIDHYTGPKFAPSPTDERPHVNRWTARRMVMEALDFLIDSDLKHTEKMRTEKSNEPWDETTYNFTKGRLESVRRDEKQIEASVDYVVGKAFQDFRRTCIGTAIAVPRAASFMVELGELPPWLNIALSRDMFIAIKAILPDTLVELSIVDTGEKKEYSYLDLAKGEPEEFARVAVAVVRATGADKISYPCGATHALDISAEKRGPDMPKTKTTQMALFNEFGRVIPLAYHGGTSLYPWAEFAPIFHFREMIRGYDIQKEGQTVHIPPSINPEWLTYKCGEKADNVNKILSSLEMPPESTDEWRGIITQININTTYLGIGQVAAFEHGLDKFVEMITMGKKAGGYANLVIERIRQSAVNNAQVVGSYGRSPFGGGIDISKLQNPKQEYNIVAPTAIQKTSD